MKGATGGMEERRILSEVTLGNIPADTIITNANLFNVFTREFIDGQSIWIKSYLRLQPGETGRIFGNKGKAVLP
jgi:hypothetical protein